jgi:murein tripeptide amidase MpaA
LTKYLVEIFAETKKDLRDLEDLNLDIKTRTANKEDESKYSVTGILSTKEIQEVKSMGYQTKIILDLSKEAINRLKEVSSINRFSDIENLSEIMTKTTTQYLNTEEVESILAMLHRLYPEMVKIIELPEKTRELRTSHAVLLHAPDNSNNGVNNSSRVGVLFTGSVHAREWGGSDICINFLISLINSYAKNADLTYGDMTFPAYKIRDMLDNIDIIVFPDVNPDGKKYSQTADDTSIPISMESIWWRKNRNPDLVPNGDNPNHATGVDINRNFDFLWNSGINTVNKNRTNSSETYRGKATFSEPESRNVKSLFDNYKNICYYVDIHSFGGKILYSWGDDSDQSVDPQMNFTNPAYNGVRGIPKGNEAKEYKEYIPKDDHDMVIYLANMMDGALAMVRGQPYKVEQSVGLYATSACSDDYAYSRHIKHKNDGKVYSFTIEFGSNKTGFIPPITEMRNIIKEISFAMTELCMLAYSNIPGPRHLTSTPSV